MEFWSLEPNSKNNILIVSAPWLVCATIQAAVNMQRLFVLYLSSQYRVALVLDSAPPPSSWHNYNSGSASSSNGDRRLRTKRRMTPSNLLHEFSWSRFTQWSTISELGNQYQLVGEDHSADRGWLVVAGEFQDGEGNVFLDLCWTSPGVVVAMCTVPYSLRSMSLLQSGIWPSLIVVDL